jgi:hypothetical protein
MLAPIFEQQADDEVLSCYNELKELFNLRKLPLFVYFFGNFPDFLKFFSHQIKTNFLNEKFLLIKQELKKGLTEISTLADIPAIKDEFLLLSLKNYKKELAKIFDINLTFSLILLAQREALKGWVFGLKKLSSTTGSFANSQEKKDYFKSDQLKQELMEIENFASGKSIILPFDEVIKRIETNFSTLLHKEQNLYFRLQIEKFLLQFLDLVPEKIAIPLEEMVKKAREDEKYLELLHLLSDSLPTLSIHKLLLLLICLKIAK